MCPMTHSAWGSAGIYERNTMNYLTDYLAEQLHCLTATVDGHTLLTGLVIDTPSEHVIDLLNQSTASCKEQSTTLRKTLTDALGQLDALDQRVALNTLDREASQKK